MELCSSMLVHMGHGMIGEDWKHAQEEAVVQRESRKQPAIELYEDWYGNGEDDDDHGCSYIDCQLCITPEEDLFQDNKTPTWSNILWIVFHCLHISEPERSFFSLKDDVYPFIWLPSHWYKLCKDKECETENQQRNIKKKIQDALSHNHKVFESGACKYKQNGFWRLKERIALPTEKKPEDLSEVSVEEERAAMLERVFNKFKASTSERLAKMRTEVGRLRNELQVLNSFDPVSSFEKLRQEVHMLIDRLRGQVYFGVEVGLSREFLSPSQLQLFEQMEKTKDI